LDFTISESGNDYSFKTSRVNQNIKRVQTWKILNSAADEFGKNSMFIQVTGYKKNGFMSVLGF